jgi:nucleoid-associated protein YgaU
MGLFDKDPKEKDKDAKERVIDFSDVQGGSSTAPVTGQDARTITVKSGDSLSAIAKRELGDASQWRAIYEANRDQIKNPDLIYPGQVLTLPASTAGDSR